jgi:hypothetical protein
MCGISRSTHPEVNPIIHFGVIYCGGHLGGRVRLPDTILEEDHPMTIPSGELKRGEPINL